MLQFFIFSQIEKHKLNGYWRLNDKYNLHIKLQNGIEIYDNRMEFGFYFFLFSEFGWFALYNASNEHINWKVEKKKTKSNEIR